MRFKRTTVVLLVVAVLAGFTASFGTKNYISRSIASYKASVDARYEKVRIAVAAADLPAGTTLNAANVSAREMPRAFLHDDAIPVERWKEFHGRTSLVAVSNGAPLLRSQIDSGGVAGFSRVLTDGKRALTVPVDQVTSLSGLLSPGDRVDILLTLNTARVRRTLVLMTDIQVLATGLDTETDTLSAARRVRNGFSTVTLLVDPEQAAKLVHGREEGSLSVALRGERADDRIWPDGVTLANLLGEAEPAPVKIVTDPGIEVILGGSDEARRHVR